MHTLAFGRSAPVAGLYWNCCVSLGAAMHALSIIAGAAASRHVRCTTVAHWPSAPRGESRPEATLYSSADDESHATSPSVAAEALDTGAVPCVALAAPTHSCTAAS